MCIQEKDQNILKQIDDIEEVLDIFPQKSKNASLKSWGKHADVIQKVFSKNFIQELFQTIMPEVDNVQVQENGVTTFTIANQFHEKYKVVRGTDGYVNICGRLEQDGRFVIEMPYTWTFTAFEKKDIASFLVSLQHYMQYFTSMYQLAIDVSRLKKDREIKNFQSEHADIFSIEDKKKWSKEDMLRQIRWDTDSRGRAYLDFEKDFKFLKGKYDAITDICDFLVTQLFPALQSTYEIDNIYVEVGEREPIPYKYCKAITPYIEFTVWDTTKEIMDFIVKLEFEKRCRIMKDISIKELVFQFSETIKKYLQVDPDGNVLYDLEDLQNDMKIVQKAYLEYKVIQSNFTSAVSEFEKHSVILNKDVVRWSSVEFPDYKKKLDGEDTISGYLNKDGKFIIKLPYDFSFHHMKYEVFHYYLYFCLPMIYFVNGAYLLYKRVIEAKSDTEACKYLQESINENLSKSRLHEGEIQTKQDVLDDLKWNMAVEFDRLKSFRHDWLGRDYRRFIRTFPFIETFLPFLQEKYGDDNIYIEFDEEKSVFISYKEYEAISKSIICPECFISNEEFSLIRDIDVWE